MTFAPTGGTVLTGTRTRTSGGALHPDNRHNRAVYGEGITPDDILYGRYGTRPPGEDCSLGT